MDEKIEKIKAISQSLTAEEKEAEKSLPANKDYFDALMKQGRKIETQGVTADAAAQDAQKPSLMDEVKNASTQVDPVSKTSTSELIAQSQETIDRISRVKEALSSSEGTLKGSYQNLLQNKLTHIDENLQIALSKAGAEFTAVDQVAAPQGLMNPIEKYIGYLTHSQDQLMHLSEQIQTMHNNRHELSPASMLAIQIKVGYVQQELEFFISLLNKALESTKTLMNVQV